MTDTEHHRFSVPGKFQQTSPKSQPRARPDRNASAVAERKILWRYRDYLGILPGKGYFNGRHFPPEICCSGRTGNVIRNAPQRQRRNCWHACRSAMNCCLIFAKLTIARRTRRPCTAPSDAVRQHLHHRKACDDKKRGHAYSWSRRPLALSSPGQKP